MSVLFYQAQAPGRPAAPLPADAIVRTWRPSEDGPPPQGSRRASNFVWWGFSRLGVFSDPGFTEIAVWRGPRLAHRHVLTPRWARFPFMAPGDLQLGDVWTDPAERRRGVARAALADTCSRLGPASGRLWYLAEEANGPSIRLAESLGFRLVGRGRRTRPFGLALGGRFRLEQSQP